MKNKILALVSLSLVIGSCGTSTYTASYTEDAIYDSSKPEKYLASAQDATPDNELAFLKKKTKQYRYNNSYSDTVYVDSNGVANIGVVGEGTYVIVDRSESYEERLRKFDRPVYTFNLNIDLDDYYYFGNPWWYRSWRYAYSPWYYRYNRWGYYGYYDYYRYQDYWAYSWYNPWYDWNYGWYGDRYGYNYPHHYPYYDNNYYYGN